MEFVIAKALAAGVAFAIIIGGCKCISCAVRRMRAKRDREPV